MSVHSEGIAFHLRRQAYDALALATRREGTAREVTTEEEANGGQGDVPA